MAMRRVKRAPQGAPQIMLTSMIDMFTILLVFLLISHSAVDLNPSDKMQLPISTAEAPAEVALKVIISKEDISVEDRAVVPVKNGRVNNHFKNGMTIVPLYDELETHVQRKLELLSQFPQLSEKIKDKILIMADEKTPAALLDEVFYTISQRNFARFHLVVLKKVADGN